MLRLLLLGLEQTLVVVEFFSFHKDLFAEFRFLDRLCAVLTDLTNIFLAHILTTVVFVVITRFVSVILVLIHF